MSITTSLAIYFVLWWIVLFAILPWGVRSQREGDIQTGTDPGAPVAPAIGRRLLWTTVISIIVFALLYAVYVYRLIPLDDLANYVWGPLRE